MPVGGQKMDRQTDRQTEKGWRRMTYSESLTTLNLFISLQIQNLSYRKKKILSKIMTFGDSAESGRVEMIGQIQRNDSNAKIKMIDEN